MNKTKTIISRAQDKAQLYYQQELNRLNHWQLHQVLGEALMEAIAPDWEQSTRQREESKQAAYISAEYLIGRLIYNNLYCAGLLEDVTEALKAQGIDIRLFEDIEDDAFGNGGLGRLAACYLDSAAAHALPLTGYGLRYRYGLFKQSFQDFKQVEEPDDWSRYGDPFSVRRYDLAVTVSLGDGDVLAVPYDMPVIGYDMKSIGTLRLWQCESLREMDFALFNQQQYAAASADKNKAEDITKFLYPNDWGPEGRLMRIKQQYVLSSATVQDILRGFENRHGKDYHLLPEHHAIQLNDTHPVMAIPELIRLLVKRGIAFEAAFSIAQNTFAYTNHTVMAEALEAWNAQELKQALPALYPIIRRINQRLLKGIKQPNMSMIRGGRVHMADLAVYATHCTNGVAEIHSQILKDDVFRDWYALYPERFQNKTNGVTQRRWLGLCNPQLTELFASRLGSEAFLTDLPRLADIKPQVDEAFLQDFMRIKQQKKRELIAIIREKEGIDIPEHFLFDVQIKRLHEYKRQLMNAFSIMAIYQGLKSGALKDFTPTAFIFGAKAAPGYQRAKAIIRYINRMADMINRDQAVRDRLKVVFVQNYNCSYAEHIIPAADVSEQISPAGTEASGTGNMKLMLNGAVTLGTYDGANIEIVQEAGEDNNYIFGATVADINRIKGKYQPKALYQAKPQLKKAVDTLIDGTFPDEDGAFKELYQSLLKGASWHTPDHYYIFLDFDAYMAAKLRANRDYSDSLSFARKCVNNALSAGKFSSDRSVQEYAREIWGL